MARRTRQSGQAGWSCRSDVMPQGHAGSVPGSNFVGRQQSCVPGSAPIAPQDTQEQRLTPLPSRLRTRKNNASLRFHRAAGHARNPTAPIALPELTGRLAPLPSRLRTRKNASLAPIALRDTRESPPLPSPAGKRGGIPVIMGPVMSFRLVVQLGDRTLRFPLEAGRVRPRFQLGVCDQGQPPDGFPATCIRCRR